MPSCPKCGHYVKRKNKSDGVFRCKRCGPIRKADVYTRHPGLVDGMFKDPLDIKGSVNEGGSNA